MEIGDLKKEDEIIKFQKYLKESEFDIQSARSFLMFIGHALNSYSNNAHKVFGFNYPQMLYFKNNHFWQIVNLKDLREVALKIYAEYEKNENIFDAYYKESEKIANKIELLKNGFKKENYKKSFQEFMKLSSELVLYFIPGEDKGQVVEQILKKELIKTYDINPSEVDDILAILTHTESRSIFSKMETEFLNLCRVYKKDGNDSKNFKNAVISYINKYYYKDTDFTESKELTFESILEKVKHKIKNSKKDEIDNEYKNIIYTHEEKLRKKETLFSKYDFSASVIDKINYLEKLSDWVNNRRKEIMIKYYAYYMIRFINCVSVYENIDMNDLFIYSPEEMMDLLKTGKKLNIEDINTKNEGRFIVYSQKAKHSFEFNSEESKKMFKLCNYKKQDFSDSFKGSVASLGDRKNKKIQGTAKVILNPKDATIKENEILVTSMTRPDFIHLMKDSMAIITNEGGISSHAAIVAREMQKPCIIGTRIATQTIKSGDLVELNLDNGIVTILKKN